MGELDPRLLEIHRQKQLQKAEAAGQRDRIIRRLLLLVFVVLLGLYLDGLHEAARQKTMQITGILNAAQHYETPSGKWVTAQPGENVLSGEGIHTGPSGSVHLDAADGSFIKVDKGSTLWARTLGYDSASGATSREFLLSSGRAWVRVTASLSSASTFVLETPGALAQTSSGRFSVVAEPSSTSISVEDGSVNVGVSGAAALLRVPAGQQILLARRARRGPAKMQTGEAAAWKAQGKDTTGVMANPAASYRRLMVGAELMLLVRPVAAVMNLLHGATSGISAKVPSLSSDPNSAAKSQNEKLAWAAANRLQAAMSDSYNELTGGYPNSIGLTDLSGVKISPTDAQAILSAFDGRQLLSYTKPSYGYLIHAKAMAPSTLVIEIDQNHVREAPSPPAP